MHTILLTISLFLFTSLSSLNAAEMSLRAGLWEISTTSDLLLLVPHIPAEQMQSVKDLASEYGFEIPPIENGAALSKACITSDMSSQQSLPIFAQNQLGCTTKNVSRVGNDYKTEFVCESPDLKGNGSADGTLTSPESFSAKTQFKGLAQGNMVDEEANISGKWIAASCGDVKPL